MVKKLSIYSNLESVYVDDGEGRSLAKIIKKNDSYILRYLDEDKPSQKIYSTGKRRISLEYGVFRIGKQRK